MHMKGYPRWFFALLLFIFAALFITGVLLTPTSLDLRLEWDVPWRLGADWHIAVAATHTAVAFVMLMLLGALLGIHARAGLRRRRNVYSGLALVAIMAVLMATAVGIYYLGDEQMAMMTALTHLAVGLGAPLLFGYHAWAGHLHAGISSGDKKNNY